MNDVMFAVLLIIVGTLALFYPLGVTVAAARAAHRRHGAIPALATATILVAAWFTAPLYTFLGSIPLLIALRLLELAAARTREVGALPRAIVMASCRARP